MSRLAAPFISLAIATAALGQSADLRAHLTGPFRIDARETLQWMAMVENVGPDRATGVEIRIGVHPLADCVSETGVIFEPGTRRAITCSGPAPAGFWAQISVSIHSHEVSDPDPSNNFVWQNIDIYTPPELLAGVWLPTRVDPGAAFGFDVSYANASRRSATSVFVDVTSEYPLTSLPANCTRVDDRHATCEIGTIGISTYPWEVDQHFLHFESTAPDTPGTSMSVTASIRAREADFAPENNTSTRSTRTYRSLYVTNANDAGSGSLRAAIESANAGCDEDEVEPCRIGFRIPPAAAAWITIQPETPLPAITRDRLVIDGRSQTTYFGDTNPNGPEIEINGSRVSSGNGLTFANHCGGSVHSLVINGFAGSGIHLGGPGCNDRDARGRRDLEASFIGTDPTGTQAVPNFRGIVYWPEGPNFWSFLVISKNLISGNRRSGIWIASGPANHINENIIGLNRTLDGPLGNGASGVYVDAPGSGTMMFDNHIGFNGHYGVSVARDVLAVEAGRNSFQANGNLAIDQGLDGVTLNAPSITSARFDPVSGTTIIEGRAERQGIRGILVTLYANDAPDESGFGEGQYYLGTAQVDSEGRYSFHWEGRLPGPWVAATSTSGGEDPVSGVFSTNTSEFGRTVQVVE